MLWKRSIGYRDMLQRCQSLKQHGPFLTHCVVSFVILCMLVRPHPSEWLALCTSEHIFFRLPSGTPNKHSHYCSKVASLQPDNAIAIREQELKRQKLAVGIREGEVAYFLSSVSYSDASQSWAHAYESRWIVLLSECVTLSPAVAWAQLWRKLLYLPFFGIVS